MRTGVHGAIATCTGCGNVWQATDRYRGGLNNVVGGVLVTCPSCSAHDLVRVSAFGG